MFGQLGQAIAIAMLAAWTAGYLLGLFTSEIQHHSPGLTCAVEARSQLLKGRR